MLVLVLVLVLLCKDRGVGVVPESARRINSPRALFSTNVAVMERHFHLGRPIPQSIADAKAVAKRRRVDVELPSCRQTEDGVGVEVIGAAGAERAAANSDDADADNLAPSTPPSHLPHASSWLLPGSSTAARGDARTIRPGQDEAEAEADATTHASSSPSPPSSSKSGPAPGRHSEHGRRLQLHSHPPVRRNRGHHSGAAHPILLAATPLQPLPALPRALYSAAALAGVAFEQVVTAPPGDPAVLFSAEACDCVIVAVRCSDGTRIMAHKQLDRGPIGDFVDTLLKAHGRGALQTAEYALVGGHDDTRERVNALVGT